MFFYKKNKKLNVMVWNCSSVDHALVKKLKQSKLLKNLYIANSDDDLKQYGEILEEKSTALIRKCKEKGIDLVISNWVANDSGIIDAFSLIGIPGIGVNKYWTKLEASKEFGKLFMRQHNIQTANYVVMTNIDEAIKYLKRTSYPIVVKADGYSKGKGSFVCQNYTEAFNAVKKILNKEIETTTEKVLIEDFLQGTEVTLMCFWDGRTLLPMLPIKDYKRLLENDKGPNTGSMGSFIPLSLPSLYKTYIKKYHKQLESALRKEKANYFGVIYSGVIINKDGLKVLEYNMRLGCPEGIAALMHMENDILEIFQAMIKQKLHRIRLKWKKNRTSCISFVAENYPYKLDENINIEYNNFERLKHNNIEVFFENLKRQSDNICILDSGELFVLCKNSEHPSEDIYKEIKNINLQGIRYRKDIGI